MLSEADRNLHGSIVLRKSRRIVFLKDNESLTVSSDRRLETNHALEGNVFFSHPIALRFRVVLSKDLASRVGDLDRKGRFKVPIAEK
jgi:hypothetical protein